MIERAGLTSRIDQQLLLSALEDTSGMPIRVSPEPGAAQVIPTSAPPPEPATPEADSDRAPHPDDSETGDD